MVTINIEKKHLFLISAIVVFVVGVGLVIGGGGTDSGSFGHYLTDLDFPSCSNGQVLKYLSGTLTCGNDKSITLGDIQNTDTGQEGGTGASLDVEGTTGTIHQAATDGLVMAWKSGNGRASLLIGPTSTSMVEVSRTNVNYAAYEHTLSSVLVKKGEYWQITKISHGTAYVRWRPIT